MIPVAKRLIEGTIRKLATIAGRTKPGAELQHHTISSAKHEAPATKYQVQGTKYKPQRTTRMSDIAIKVENLSKLYKIGARQHRYKTFHVQLPFAMVEKEERIGAGRSGM